MNKLLASASALAICLSSSLGATETNDWFEVGFGTGYTANVLVTNNTASGENGAWTGSGGDASTVTNMAVKGQVARLDTQGGQLTWTPTVASSEQVVLIDTDVYLVGSDEAPTTVTTGVQTEVYLKNLLNASSEVTNSVLCAHVYEGSANAWVDLDGVAITNQTWVELRIEINYGGTDPMVTFWVNDIRMEKVGSSTSSFRVMDATKTAVTSVSFMGTGYIDNFIGWQVKAPAVEEGWDGEATSGTHYAVSGNTMTVSFADTVANSTGTDALRYVQLAGPDGYVRTYRTSDGDAAYFDVSGLATGSYTITAYYGDAPTVVPAGYKPAAETVEDKPAAAVVDDNGKKLRINVAPVSGLHYTLFVGTDSVLPGDLSAAAASKLALPDDEDAGFLQIDMPAPTTANGVNLIKIYASDESYAAEAAAPDAP